MADVACELLFALDHVDDAAMIIVEGRDQLDDFGLIVPARVDRCRSAQSERFKLACETRHLAYQQTRQTKRKPDGQQREGTGTGHELIDHALEASLVAVEVIN